MNLYTKMAQKIMGNPDSYLFSGVVHPSLQTRYASPTPNTAAHFAEQMQAIGAPNPGRIGEGVVRVYPRDGAKYSVQNEYLLPQSVAPIFEMTPSQARQLKIDPNILKSIGIVGAGVGASFIDPKRAQAEALQDAFNPVEYLSPARWGGGLINMGIDALLSTVGN